jgi:hypothetical protein
LLVVVAVVAKETLVIHLVRAVVVAVVAVVANTAITLLQLCPTLVVAVVVVLPTTLRLVLVDLVLSWFVTQKHWWVANGSLG